MKTYLLILFSFIFCSTAFAQFPSKYSLNAELGGALGNKSSILNFATSHHISLGQNKNVQFYYGLRSNNIFNNSKMFDVSKKDTSIEQTSTSYVFANNIFLGINYFVFKGFSLGINTDVIGLSWGSTNEAYYDVISLNGGFYYVNKAISKPSMINLFTFYTNDLGSLNSEIYLQYLFESNWKIKFGLSHLTTTLELNGGGLTETKYARNTLNLFFVNVGYRIWQK